MKQDFLAHFPYIWATCLALVLFVVLFVGAVIWVFRGNGKKLYHYMAAMPFNEETPL